MKKFAVIGVYGNGENFTTGQAVKCYELINWLNNNYKNNVYIVNTYKWKKKPLRLFVSLIKSFKHCENVIILPAQHGLKVFGPLCYFFQKIFNRRIYYIVIGGWLPEVLSKNKMLKKYVKSFDGVFVETKSMVINLKSIGINKCYYLPNSRKIPMVETRRKLMEDGLFKVCTYSRVTKDKGILDAIEIVANINKNLSNKIKLDIYGKIDESFKEELNLKITDNKSFVRYCGVKNADEGIYTLSKYDALIFPTYYEGEGFAGTILDAFASGTPVIANDWKYNKEIINNGKTGMIYPFRDIESASKELLELFDKDKYNFIVENCIRESKKYTPDIVFRKFVKIIDCDRKEI